MAINKAGIHRILKNPIYYGEFIRKGKKCRGNHGPIVSRHLFDEVQKVFERANHHKETKRNPAFAGLLECGKCGCSMTPEMQKDKYVLL